MCAATRERQVYRHFGLLTVVRCYFGPKAIVSPSAVRVPGITAESASIKFYSSYDQKYCPFSDHTNITRCTKAELFGCIMYEKQRNSLENVIMCPVMQSK